MSSVRNLDTYRSHAAALGGAVVAGLGAADGEPVRAFVQLEGPWDAPRLLERLAAEDAATLPLVRELGRAAARANPSPSARARALHAFVRRRVKFERENGEVFRSTAVTLDRGAGDCDDSARALVALAKAAGLRSRFAYLESNGQPVHVYAEIHDGRAWQPAETTIDARFAEAPLAAARRLGVKHRADLSGTPRHLDLGEIDPMNPIAPHDLFTTPDTWEAPGRAIVRLLVEASALLQPGDVRGDLEALGFERVTVTDKKSDLDLDWPSKFTSANPSSPGVALFFVQATGGPVTRTFSRDQGRLHVRLAWQVDQFSNEPVIAEEFADDDLPPIPPLPASGARSPWARVVLLHAWRKVFGKTGPKLNEATIQGVLAVATVETDLLRSSGSQALWNFGNIHCANDTKLGQGQTCDGRTPGGKWATTCKPHGDSDNAGAGYMTCFRAYLGPVEGMADFVEVLCRPRTRAALLSGDAQAIAEAMRSYGYYGFDADEERQNAYGAAIYAQAAIVAEKTGQPKMVRRGTPLTPSGGISGTSVALLVLSGAILAQLMKG